MLTLMRLKSYLKIDYDDEDDNLTELLDSSVAVIASSTGVDVFRIINGGNTELLYSFRTRYCRFTKALELDTRTYKIKYMDKYFNIISANDYGMAHLYIDVKAVRVHDE